MIYTVNDYCRKIFGEKAYKISLDAGFTCPNRDGSLDTRGCIFCSAGGSGDFAPDRCLPLDVQIEEAKQRIRKKYKGNSFIAYFQAYTNTYASYDKLRKLYFPIIERKDISGLSIATRPDCLSKEIISLLDELNKIKPTWIELGLQTSNDKTAEYIRRGYTTDVYDRAVYELKKINIHVITHVILGLPYENLNDMISTVEHTVETGTDGIKLQLLHVLKGTELEREYLRGKFRTLTLEEYLYILKKCLEVIPDNVVIHRLTGDGSKKLLVAPLWSSDKKRVINAVRRITENRDEFSC